MSSIVRLLGPMGFLLLPIVGWGLFGFTYYRVIRNKTVSRAAYHGLLVTFIMLMAGIIIGDEAARRSTEETTTAFLLGAIAEAWLFVPYVLAAALAVFAMARKRHSANKAL